MALGAMQSTVLQQQQQQRLIMASVGSRALTAGCAPCPTPTRPSTRPSVAAAAAGPFAAAPEPLLPLSSIADMRRAAATDRDDFFLSSPFSSMRRLDDMWDSHFWRLDDMWDSDFRRLDDMWDSQFQAMDPFSGGGSGLSSMRAMEDTMRQQMRDMDRQFDRAFGDLDKMQRELDAELQRGLRQLQEQQPGVRIERREEKSPQSYRYYESIQISRGTGYTTLTPAHTTFFNPLLLAAVVLAGAWAAVTAAFARNYDLTLFGERSKWKLLLLWPVLALSSKQFRRQLSSALRGEKVRVQEEAEDGSSSIGSGGSS